MVGCRIIVLQSELIDTVVPAEAARIIGARWGIHERIVVGARGHLIIWLHQVVGWAELAGGRLE